MNTAIKAAERQARVMGFNYACNESEYWLQEMKTIVRALTMLEILDTDTACEVVEGAFWSAYDKACEMV